MNERCASSYDDEQGNYIDSDTSSYYQCLTAKTTITHRIMTLGYGSVNVIIPVLLLMLLVCSGIVFFRRQRQRNRRHTPKRQFAQKTINETRSSSSVDSNLDTNSDGTQTHVNGTGMSMSGHIPFIVWTAPDWRILHKAVREYREESVRALHTLSRNLEHVRTSEELRGFHKPGSGKLSNSYLLSDSLQQRLNRLADIYEADATTLQDIILQPHAYTKVLSPPPPPPPVADEPRATAKPPTDNRSDEQIDNDISTTTGANRDTTTSATKDDDTPASNRAPPRSISTIFAAEAGTTTAAPTGDAAYSQARQILAHLARDWSTAGFSVRQTLYPWCQDQLHQYSYDDADNSNANRSVLVPGAGLGRLAWELAQDGWTVHALEASPVMAAAAASMLHYRPTNDEETNRSTIRIHPYAMDMFANEVDANGRYESVPVPDVRPGKALRRQRGPSQSQGYLSYTIGLFGGDSTPTTSTTTTSTSSRAAHIEQPYAAIVTCFFIDTATNIYDYLDTIAASVERGGLWINVGPLQWHGNAIVSMTVTDLRSVLESDCQDQRCWEILEWSVDPEPVPYRTSDDISQQPRSTNYDGFRPLRFVARKL